MRNIFTQKLYKLSITQLCLNQLESGMKSQMKYISSNYAICTLCYSVCHMAFYDYDIQQLLFIPLRTVAPSGRQRDTTNSFNQTECHSSIQINPT